MPTLRNHHEFLPELSDYIIDFDHETGERIPVRVADVVDMLEAHGFRGSARLARRLPRRGEYFDEVEIDGVSTLR